MFYSTDATQHACADVHVGRLSRLDGYGVAAEVRSRLVEILDGVRACTLLLTVTFARRRRS